MEKTILYTENGDNYHGDNYSFNEAKKYLKEKGYKIAYSGRKFTANGERVLVGINENNIFGVEHRRKNGLFRASAIRL